MRFLKLVFIIFTCEKLCSTEAVDTGIVLTEYSTLTELSYYPVIFWKSNDGWFSILCIHRLLMTSHQVITLYCRRYLFQLHNDSTMSQLSPHHMSVALMKWHQTSLLD